MSTARSAPTTRDGGDIVPNRLRLHKVADPLPTDRRTRFNRVHETASPSG